MRLGQHEAVTISREALQAMLQPSPVLTVEQRQALKKERELMMERARAHAKERKQRMLQVHTPHVHRLAMLALFRWKRNERNINP